MTKLPNFLLLGPEIGEKELFISRIKKKILSSDFGKPDEYIYFPYDADLTEIVSIFRSQGLFADSILAIFNNIEDLNKEQIKILTGYLTNPSPSTCVILCSGETRIDPKLDKCFKKEQKKIFWELFENQKRDWVQGFFKNQGIRIDSDAVELLLSLVDNNTKELKNECSRLLLSLDQPECITGEQVEKFIFHTKEENVFTLFEVIARGDLENALEILRQIVSSGDSNGIQILAGLLWQFRKTLNISCLCEERYSLEEAFRQESIRGKKIQAIYRSGINTYSRKELQRIIILFEEFDRALRTIRLENHLLDLFLYSIVKRKGRAVFRFGIV